MSDKKVYCKIGPSILNSDLSRLAEESQKLLDAGADYLHLDVMDGTFVPNITFGHPVIKSLRQNIPEAFFEAHMMVQNPEQWIEAVADAGADQYTFHIEPCDNVPMVCRKVKETGMKVGLAIKPNTNVECLNGYVDLVDTILVMTVEPGFGGQKFIYDMMSKVKWLRENYPSIDIGIDGGVGLDTIVNCAEAGANAIVSGTAITASKDPKSVISNMRSILINSFPKLQDVIVV